MRRFSHLSEHDIHAIINQMEVPMSLKAAELADSIATKKAEAEKRAYEDLKQKILGATTKMAVDLVLNTEVEVSPDEMIAVPRVTEQLRELDYKFCLIEVQSVTGDIVKHRLRISIAHMMVDTHG